MSDTDKPATLEDYASADWEPWSPGALDSVPSNKQWPELANPHHLVMVRLAVRAMTMTRAEVIELVRNLARDPDPDGVDADMCKSVTEKMRISSEWFSAFAEVLDAARTRLLCAAAADVAAEEGP